MSSTAETVSTVTVRRLEPAEFDAAFALAQALRPHLTPPMFTERIAHQVDRLGYELYGAFADGDLVGLAGGRAMMSLHRGAHYYLDDLVVAESGRGRSIGRQLLGAVEDDARARGFGSFHLAARASAIGFYERLGYEMSPSPLMIKNLD